MRGTTRVTRPPPKPREEPTPPREPPHSEGGPIDVGNAIAQAKLTVGPSDDRFEREADNTARRVVRSVGAIESATSEASSAVCDVRRVQRAATVDAEGSSLDHDTEQRITRARRSGRPLDDAIRRAMEPAFGTDFGDVRVHEGPTARDLNDQIQARAFTVGSDVFFRDGVPDVSSKGGQALIAHELTHTLQQGAQGQAAQRVQRFRNPFKRERSQGQRRNYGTTIKPRQAAATPPPPAAAATPPAATPPAAALTVPTLSLNSRALTTVGVGPPARSKSFKRLVAAVSAYELVVGSDRVASALGNLEKIRSHGLSWLEANPRGIGKNKYGSDADIRDDKEQVRALIEQLVFSDTLRVETMLTSGDDGLTASGSGPTSGSVSAVSVYADAQGNKSFFKRYEYGDDYADAADAAADAGIGAGMIGAGTPSERAFLANRAVASSKLDELFGFGIVPKTKFSTKNGVFGTMQAGAAGYSPQESTKLVTPNDPDPYSTSFLRVDANDKGLYNDPTLMRNLNTLQLFDSITGQVDRHPGNYFVQRVGTEVRVAAIDNDLSFGKFNYQTEKDGSKKHVGVDVKGRMAHALPTFIDRGVVERALTVTADDVRATLRPLLPPAEVDYTVQRWELISSRLHAMQSAHRIVSEDEWKRLANTQKQIAAGGRGMTSYAGVLAAKADAALTSTTHGQGTAIGVGTSAKTATQLLAALKAIDERVDSRRAGEKDPDGQKYNSENAKMLTIDEKAEVESLLTQLAALDAGLLDSSYAYKCRQHVDRFRKAIHWTGSSYGYGSSIP